MIRMRTAIVAVIALLGCRGNAPATAQSLDQRQLEALVDSLMPSVARATGLEFKSTPRSAVRTPAQVRTFLLARLEQELPPERIEGMTTMYRLLGMLPDTLDLPKLIIDLYSEQVAGFYDPDSSVLYAVAGADRAQLRLILAHELVHALQHQYIPIDSIMRDVRNADRLAAAQAVLEGQATLVSMLSLVPDTAMLSDEGFWDTYRNNVRSSQASMKVFRSAPLVLREGLIFPYLTGAEFARWHRANRRGQPFDPPMPVSTEQILHPDRLARGDAPVALRFTGDSAGVIHEDTFGELEIAILRASLAGIGEVPTDLPLGWGGDRMRVYRWPAGPALVWYSVWDTPRDAELFRQRIGDRVAALVRAGYRGTSVPIDVGGRPGVRIVFAPTDWGRWDSLPAAEVVPQ